MFCKHCGAEINDNAVICMKCGCQIDRIQQKEQLDPTISDRNGIATLLLCFFLGCFGIHSFYAGRTGAGIGQLLTLGGCGIWALIDFVMIIVGTYKDAEGKFIKI